MSTVVCVSGRRLDALWKGDTSKWLARFGEVENASSEVDIRNEDSSEGEWGDDEDVAEEGEGDISTAESILL